MSDVHVILCYRKELETIYELDPSLFEKEFVWIVTKSLNIANRLPDLPIGLLGLGNTFDHSSDS